MGWDIQIGTSYSPWSRMKLAYQLRNIAYRVDNCSGPDTMHDLENDPP